MNRIKDSMNFDGGFGLEPGGESHGGQGQLTFHPRRRVKLRKV